MPRIFFGQQVRDWIAMKAISCSWCWRKCQLEHINKESQGTWFSLTFRLSWMHFRHTGNRERKNDVPDFLLFLCFELGVYHWHLLFTRVRYQGIIQNFTLPHLSISHHFMSIPSPKYLFKCSHFSLHLCLREDSHHLLLEPLQLFPNWSPWFCQLILHFVATASFQKCKSDHIMLLIKIVW